MLPYHRDGLGRGDVISWRPVVLPLGAVEVFLDDLLPPRESVAPHMKEIMAEFRASIDGFALQREYAEHALVYSSQRLPLHKPLESFETSGSQAFEVLGRGVFRPVDKTKVFSAPALNRRLHQSTASLVTN